MVKIVKLESSFQAFEKQKILEISTWMDFS